MTAQSRIPGSLRVLRPFAVRRAMHLLALSMILACLVLHVTVARTSAADQANTLSNATVTLSDTAAAEKEIAAFEKAITNQVHNLATHARSATSGTSHRATI